MIAMMSLQDVGPIIEANGFVTVSNPPAEPEAWVLATPFAFDRPRRLRFESLALGNSIYERSAPGPGFPTQHTQPARS